MITELNGKEVVVHLGIFAAFTDSVTGKVVSTNDQWIQVKTKKQLEFIPVTSIKRIILVG